MRCYNCGEQLTNSDVCANCGTDVSGYKILVKASNSYYNQGLMKAQIRDLTGAVVCLRTSLSINKYNIKARNLLGLVYYEMGEVVAALSQWVLSKNYKPEKNAADVFIRKVQSNQNKLEAMNQTIKKFNRCLEYAKDGSYDVAKIQLKKVIATNPKLIKAHLLLSLLLMREDDYDKAKKYLQKCLQIDKGNTLAMVYLKEAEDKITEKKHVIEVDYTKPKENKKIKDNEPRSLSGHDVIIPKGTYKEPSNGAITVVNLLIGVAIGAALIWYLVMPAAKKGVTADNKKQVKEYVEQLSNANAEIARLESKVKELTEERDSLSDGNQSSGDALSKYTSIVDAKGMLDAGDFVGAAETLAGIDSAALSNENAKQMYNQIWTDCFIKAYDELMASGNGARNSGDEASAAGYYKRAFDINPTEDAAYGAGVAYMNADDKENAKIYLQYVIDNFPGNWSAEDSKERLARIG